MKSTETILAEIQKDIKHLDETHKRCFQDIKEQISKSEEDTQKQLDNHCPRIRNLEANLGQLDIQEEIAEIKKVQAVRISNLTKVVAALAIGATLICQKVWAFIFS